AAAALVIALTSGGARAPQARGGATRYGRLPSWLPKLSNTTRLEQARASRPVLSEEQGYTIRAELPTGSADVTAVGPQMPSKVAQAVQSGSWPHDRLAPGTFLVTLAHVRGSVPLSAGAFSILTDLGVIEHPKVTVKGGGALPPALHSGQHLALAVTAQVSEGAGSVRWAPLGPKVLVGWIYQLELD
ncbi:MAG: hypothetical protein KGL15_08980, partial [Acidobacteriota bacterium]|nr:hypothetical protein [Acidobacteriota bacterium]